MKDKKDAAIQKRDAITKANRTMFLSIAGASFILGASVVGSIFLLRMIAFKAKVIGVQNESISNIQKSTENVEKLTKELSAMRSNEILKTSRANKEEDDALQVVADALPATENTSALGASLTKIFTSEGITVESINPSGSSIDVSGSSSSEDSSISSYGTSGSETAKLPAGVKALEFSVVLSAKDVTDATGKTTAGLPKLIDVLNKMELSIRTIDITNFKFEKSKEANTLTLTIRSFYLPAYTLKLDSKTVKSDDTKKTTSAESNSKNSTTGGTK